MLRQGKNGRKERQEIPLNIKCIENNTNGRKQMEVKKEINEITKGRGV